MKLLAVGYFVVVTITSLVSFVAYGWDKRRARLGGRRISERTLHTIALFGGWPGAFAGQRIFRHKTQKLSFRLAFWIVGLLHLAVVVAVAYAMLT